MLRDGTTPGRSAPPTPQGHRRSVRRRHPPSPRGGPLPRSPGERRLARRQGSPCRRRAASPPPRRQSPMRHPPTHPHRPPNAAARKPAPPPGPLLPRHRFAPGRVPAPESPRLQPVVPPPPARGWPPALGGTLIGRCLRLTPGLWLRPRLGRPRLGVSGRVATEPPPAHAARTSSTVVPDACARAAAERWTIASGALSARAAASRFSLIDGEHSQGVTACPGHETVSGRSRRKAIIVAMEQRSTARTERGSEGEAAAPSRSGSTGSAPKPHSGYWSAPSPSTHRMTPDSPDRTCSASLKSWTSIRPWSSGRSPRSCQPARRLDGWGCSLGSPGSGICTSAA